MVRRWCLAGAFSPLLLMMTLDRAAKPTRKAPGHAATAGAPSAAIRQELASEDDRKALLRGMVFPAAHEFKPDVPSPSRTYPVSTGAALLEKLCELEPGDRVVLGRGTYTGRFEITKERGCRDGTAARPVQVVGEDGAVVDGAVRAGRSHWQFIGLEVTPGRDNDLPAIRVESSHVLLERMHLHDGRFNGVVIAGTAEYVVISNSHIHGFDKRDARGDPVDAHGVVVWAGASQVKLVGNEIHHNSGDGIQVNGPGDGSIPEHQFARNVEILGNRFHDDVENAVDIKDARDVVVKDNKMWSYAPAPAAYGQAISVAYDAANITIAGNHIWKTRGIFVGRGSLGPSRKPAAGKPRNVFIVDNYLENPSPEGVAFFVAGVQCLAIYHNVVRNFSGGVAVRSGTADTAHIRVANNIFLEISTLGFWLTSDYSEVVDLFDYNAFASAGGEVRVQIGGMRAEDANHVFALKDHIGPNQRMPHTSVAAEVVIANNDLAKVTGLRSDHAGVPVHLGPSCEGKALQPRGGESANLGVR